MRSSLIRSFECSCSVSAYLSMPSMRSSRVFGSQPARVIVGRHVQSRDLAAAPGEPAGLSEMSLSLWKSSLALLQASKWRFRSRYKRSQLPDRARGPLACDRGPCGCLVFATRCTLVVALRHLGEGVESNGLLLERPVPAVSRRRGGGLRGNGIRCVF